MSSLKEIKSRIASVRSTLKITSAMKMVSSAKLHRAQQWIGNMVPYQEFLGGILADLVSTGVDISSMVTRNDSKRVAVLAFSSNSSLCGGFNANVIKGFNALVRRLEAEELRIPSEDDPEKFETLHRGHDDIDVYVIGRKMAEAVRKAGFTAKNDRSDLEDHPSYDGAAELARQLVDSFNAGEIGRVVLLYSHYASNSSQPVTTETYLPFSAETVVSTTSPSGEAAQPRPMDEDCIIEPTPAEVVEQLLPKVLLLKIYTVLLDNYAAEHAARTLAMQIASDNAEDLLDTLNLEYNKSRQQAITSELLDIVGGSMN